MNLLNYGKHSEQLEEEIILYFRDNLTVSPVLSLLGQWFLKLSVAELRTEMKNLTAAAAAAGCLLLLMMSDCKRVRCFLAPAHTH